MTQPISHGYPDYGRYSATSDVLFLNINAESVNPSIDHGPFFLGGQQYVALKMSPDTKSFQYQLIWTTDAAGTITLAIEGAIMPQASSNTLIFPVMGPWLTIRATPRTGPGSHGLVAFMVPDGASSVGADANQATFTSGGFNNIAGVTTLTFDFTNVYAGQASVWTYISAASGLIQVQVLDLAGNATPIASGPDTGLGGAAVGDFEIMLPPRPLRIVVINRDAVVKQYAFAVVGRPFHGGR